MSQKKYQSLTIHNILNQTNFEKLSTIAYSSTFKSLHKKRSHLISQFS